MENKNIEWSTLAFLNTDIVSKIDDNTPGAYRLSYKDKDEKFYVFFVGEAFDIKESLLSHISDSESPCVKTMLSEYKCAFRYSRIEEKELRQVVLRQAYKLYQPKCNDAMPDGRDDITVNLV